MDKQQWWETSGDKPSLVDVVRFTENSVWLATDPDRRRSRITSWKCFFPIWVEAKTWLQERADRGVENAHKKIAHANLGLDRAVSYQILVRLWENNEKEPT